MNNLLPGSGGGVGVVRILWIESDGDDRMSSSVRNSRFYGGGLDLIISWNFLGW